MPEQTDNESPKKHSGAQRQKHDSVASSAPAKTGWQGNRQVRLLVLFFTIFLGAFALSAWMMPELRQRIPLLDHILPAPPPQAGRIATLESDVDTLKRTVASLSARADADAFDSAALRRQGEGISIQISDLEGRLNQLTGGKDLPPGRPLTGKSAATRLDLLAARLAQLEAAFQPLSRSVQAEAEAAKDRALMRNRAGELEKQITALNERISALETFATTDRQGSILGLTLAQLQSTIDSGRPYETPLGLLLDLVPDSSLKKDSPARDSINILQSHAPEGVATPDQLSQRFNRMSTAVLRAAAIPDDASWLGRAWGRLKGLIIIRKRGEVPGNTPAAIVARAEVRLSEDDINGALSELEALKGSAAEAAKPWVEAALARQDVDGAIEQLSSLLEEEAVKRSDTPKKGER